MSFGCFHVCTAVCLSSAVASCLQISYGQTWSAVSEQSVFADHWSVRTACRFVEISCVFRSIRQHNRLLIEQRKFGGRFKECGSSQKTVTEPSDAFCSPKTDMHFGLQSRNAVDDNGSHYFAKRAITTIM